MEKNMRSELREYAWKYFALHADQRLKTFNFYLILSTLLVGASVTTWKNNAPDCVIQAAIYFLIVLFSVVFWKLDLRNKELVRNGENAIRILDSAMDISNEPNFGELRLFARDDVKTSARDSNIVWQIIDSTPWSYSRCFATVFFVLGYGSLVLFLSCLFLAIFKQF